MFRPSSARLCAASPFPRCACRPLRSPRRVLRLRCLAEPPLRNLFSSKSYTRAGLQGIVNCSCSANLHKSILNQLSGLRRVRARRLAAWKRTGYAQVPDATQRDATRRHVPFLPINGYTQGVSNGTRCKASICVSARPSTCRLTACVFEFAR